MALRLFLDLASRLMDHRNVTEIIEPPETGTEVLNYQDPVKFHIGMLSISLLVGLAYAGYVSYCHWMEKETLVGYVRNLVIALVCRTFFSILFDGVILLGSLANVGGGNALLAFEQISGALVLAFWLTLTIYLHARVQRDFNSEPTLRVYMYGVPGVALFFAFVWIFTLQDQQPNLLWWLVQLVQVYARWIVNGVYLLFLLVQLGLVSDIVRMVMTKKSSVDNDSVTLFMRVGIIMGALVLIFWLQFGLCLGRMSNLASSSYIYFDYFIDGLEGTLVCVCLYFFLKWVPAFTKSSLRCQSRESETETTTVSDSTTGERVPDGRGESTFAMAIFTSEQSGRFSTSQDDGRNDVVYSNVIEPERLKKTLELYNRLDVIPKPKVTVVDGEQFYDCQMPTSVVYETEARKPSKKNIFDVNILNEKNKNLKPQKSLEHTQNRNAFYSSKYLILDQKDVKIPKHLETRPSISSTSRTSKEERISMPSDIPDYETREMVNKWLSGNAEGMRPSAKTEPGSRGSVIEGKSKDPTIDNESRISTNEKSTKKPEHVTPEIVTHAEAQSPKSETPAEVKHLNLDQKDVKIPKHLETRPSISSTSSTPKEEGILSDIPVYETGEMVNKWLSGNAEDMRASVKTELGSRGSVEEGKSKDPHTIDNENRIPTNEKSTKKPELMTPEIVTNAEAQSPKSETPAEVIKHHENEEIFISTTTVSKLVEKMDLSTPSPTSEELSEEPATCQPPQTEEDSTKRPQTNEEPQHPATTLSDEYITFSELLEFRKRRDSTTHSPPASKRSSGIFENISSVINSLTKVREIFHPWGHTDVPEEAETLQQKSIATKPDRTIKIPPKLISLPDSYQGIHTKVKSSNAEVNTSEEIKKLNRSENVKEDQIYSIPNTPRLVKNDYSPDDLGKSDKNDRPMAEKEPEPKKPNIVIEEPEAEHLKPQHALNIDPQDKNDQLRAPERNEIEDRHSHPKETLRTDSGDHEGTDPNMINDTVNEKTKGTPQQPKHSPRTDPYVSLLLKDDPYLKKERANEETETKHSETSEIDSENDITEPDTEEEEAKDTPETVKITEERLLDDQGITTRDPIFTTLANERCNTRQENERNDVLYSNIIQPERLKKTLELRSRFDVTPKKAATVKKPEVISEPKSSSSSSFSSSEELNEDDIKPYLDQINNPSAKPREGVEPDDDMKKLIPRQIYKETIKEPSESSDSEFSLERGKTSRDTFSLEDYYSKLSAVESKITTRQNFPRFNNSLGMSRA